MEHPEKALFDEVRGLRNQLEEAKERVSKIEIDYNEKVLAYETRKTINDRLEVSLEKFLNDTKKVTIIINGKEKTFLRSFFTNNLFSVNFLTEEDTYELDLGKKEFKGLISILRAGNNYSVFQKEDVPRRMTLEDTKLKENKGFIIAIRNFLTEDSFELILNKFNMNYTYGNTDKDLIENVSIENPFINEKLDTFRAEKGSDIQQKDTKIQKAFFINGDGKIDITLKHKIRIGKVVIRGFYSNPSNWNSTLGNSTTRIFVSVDGDKWDQVGVVPATYGTGKDTCFVEFDRLTCFRYLRFQSEANNSFSLNYISFK